MDSLSYKKTSKENSGRVCWQSPSNIALIKYWGKYEGQIPANPSLSLTLRHATTEMDVEYELDCEKEFPLEFYFEGQAQPLFQKKIEKFLQSLRGTFDFLKKCRLKIRSSNSFPHSAGIASSASSMSALALCLCSIERRAGEASLDAEDFFRRASHIARLGSGSACRSVYGPLCTWGAIAGIEGSSDDYASPLAAARPDFESLCDSILIVDSTPKSVSSRAGHDLMRAHPFAEARFRQARENLQGLLVAMEGKDFASFAEIVELEAMTLHALMMSSRPSFVLIKPHSLALIEKIRSARLEQGLPLCFTIDAGPNIHLLYPQGFQSEARAWIDRELGDFCENGTIIHDQGGTGPVEKLD